MVTIQTNTLDAAANALFTCLSCQVAFETPHAQRGHYQTDWHRYNLKRKVAELPPVSSTVFADKVTAQRTKGQPAETASAPTLECQACTKTYSTANAYNNHIQSKKHKEAAIRFENGSNRAQNKFADKKEGELESPGARQREQPFMVTEDMTEEEVVAAIDKKIEVAIRLAPEDCLFCTTRSETFELNMEHMTHVHSLFIPDIEYISDLPGLIKYLGEKISVTNVCLLCNGRGRAFKSMEAVRGHMVDKSHCKIAYDSENNQLEIAEFYDFSSSYPDAEAMEDEEMGELRVEGEIAFGDVETELVLPSGARVGHRSMRRYYRQHLREEENRDSVIINRLITHYDTNQLARVSGGKNALVKAIERSGQVGKAAHIRAEQRAQRSKNVDFTTRVGYKGNSQKHYRDELLQ